MELSVGYMFSRLQISFIFIMKNSLVVFYVLFEIYSNITSKKPEK